MSRNQQRILELHSLLSKLLDSLCCEVCVNMRDANSLSLLQILLWMRKGDIDETQFMELYRSWLESKSVFDLLTCRQGEIYPKSELIAQEVVQQNFMNIGQINKALEVVNTAYNKMYREKRPNNWAQLEQAQRIFSYLDEPGYIHLRLSSLFFLTGAIVVLERYTVPINYQAFRIHMNDLRKQTCQVQGVVSLRSFKNYILNLNSAKRANYLDSLLNIFAQMETAIGSERNSLPNLFDEAFAKWRNFPRFGSNQGRKNLQIYKRVFEENQRVFMDEGASLDYFQGKYGEQFVKCFQIDNLMLRQFNVLLKESLNRYIELFARVGHKYNSRNSADKGSNLFMTHRKKQTSELQQLKMGNKGSSMKQKTPTKSQKTIEFRNNKTPTKTLNFDNNIRKQFGSADKSKSKNYGRRQLTPTKSFRPQTAVLHQSQANPSHQKNAIKLGVEKDSVYNRMQFFRNKRVESYQIVMKRLKNIK